VRLPGPTVALGAAAAWLLEAPVVWQAARWAGLDLSPLQALLDTVVSVAAQVLAVAPGGLGTYQAAGVAAYALLGHRPGPALAAALVAHAAKTAYALAAGVLALVVPAPGAIGRLRLPPPSHQVDDHGTPPPRPGEGPVVLFLPAHNEEASVAGVVARVPPSVCGRPVQCLVVDDGSTDATARLAAAAGAQVVAMAANQGLAATVRCGLAEALDRRAAAVAFCDADGEYDPAELHRLVAPILEGGPTMWSAPASRAPSTTCWSAGASATSCSPGSSPSSPAPGSATAKAATAPSPVLPPAPR
jgi:Glycosyl transferase family 2/Lysylphosphatidylglycerol synthase TM region